MPRYHAHLLRRGRYSEPGRPYLLTTVTQDRQPLFHDFHLARLVIHQLQLSVQEGTFQSLAWVLMPDHLHWLVELKDASLATLMRKFKSRSSLALHRAGVAHERIWQPGYQDRALRREESIRHVARYIVANPLRAGLVMSVREYPHWDAVWL